MRHLGAIACPHLAVPIAKECTRPQPTAALIDDVLLLERADPSVAPQERHRLALHPAPRRHGLLPQHCLSSATTMAIAIGHGRVRIVHQAPPVGPRPRQFASARGHLSYTFILHERSKVSPSDPRPNIETQ